jgi:hypothetical protein
VLGGVHHLPQSTRRLMDKIEQTDLEKKLKGLSELELKYLARLSKFGNLIATITGISSILAVLFTPGLFISIFAVVVTYYTARVSVNFSTLNIDVRNAQAHYRK